MQVNALVLEKSAKHAFMPIKPQQLTSLVQVVWFLVTDLVIFRWTPWFRPPVRCLLVASSVRMSRLLLGLDGLDPGFGNELAGCLLAVLEPLLVEAPHSLRVTNSDATSRRHSHLSVFVLVERVAWPRSLPARSSWAAPVSKGRTSAAISWSASTEDVSVKDGLVLVE